jgi:DNA-binding NtrC family response regulator
MRPISKLSLVPAAPATKNQPHELPGTAKQAMADNAPHPHIVIELSTDHAGLNELKEELERVMVERTLRETRGNIAKAARHLGISRPKLYDLISHHGLRRARRDRLDSRE